VEGRGEDVDEFAAGGAVLAVAAVADVFAVAKVWIHVTVVEMDSAKNDGTIAATVAAPSLPRYVEWSPASPTTDHPHPSPLDPSRSYLRFDVSRFRVRSFGTRCVDAAAIVTVRLVPKLTKSCIRQNGRRCLLFGFGNTMHIPGTRNVNTRNPMCFRSKMKLTERLGPSALDD
jgi:hypothetical protein